jgi:hypothetical protein
VYVNDRHLQEVVSLILLLYSYDPEIPNVPQLCDLLRARIHPVFNPVYIARYLNVKAISPANSQGTAFREVGRESGSVYRSDRSR